MSINVKTTNNYFERTETLVKYYHAANEFDLMDADKEKEMFYLLDENKHKLKIAKESGDKLSIKKIENEIKAIRDYIIKSNLRFVISIARVYATNRNLLDVINEGNVGLIEAVNTFDVSLGNRFQTHAVYLIRQKINLYRQNADLMVKKNNESKTYHILSNMTNKFMQEFNREPSSEELKDYINKYYPKANIKDSADVLKVTIASIDDVADSEDGDANIGNIAAFNAYSSSYNDYESKIENEHLSSIVSTLLSGFSNKEKTIIKMHFGIEQPHNAPAPITEIAHKVNLTPERVRQIIKEMKIKIKEEYGKKLRFI